jgi:type I restriction enzyme S subunit
LNNSEGTRDDLKINETAPPEWRIVKLSEVADVVSGYGFPLKYQGKEQGTYPFVKVGDMNLSDKYVNTASNFVGREELKQLHAKVFPSGTTIFPKIGMAVYLNKFRILSVEATFDNNVAGIVPRRIHDEFLYYYFVSRVDLKAISNIRTMPSIKKSTLENLQIPCPSLNEQQRIAEILSTADEAIQMVNDQITQTEHLKKGLMQTLLTKGIGHTKFKMTEIGEIPEEWETSVLNNVVDIMDHKRIPLSEAQRMNKKGPYPYCGANGIIDYIDNFIFDDECVLLAEDGGTYEKFENKAYIMDGKYWVNNHAHVIKGKQGIAHNRFILYWLNFSDIRKYITGSTRTKLNLENLKKIPLPKIPLPEQQKIADILTTVDDKLKLLRNKREYLEKLKKGLMGELLTGRVRVKV